MKHWIKLLVWGSDGKPVVDCQRETMEEIFQIVKNFVESHNYSEDNFTVIVTKEETIPIKIFRNRIAVEVVK